MLTIYKTVENEIVRTTEMEEGVWVNLAAPTNEEVVEVSERLGVELDYVRAALDEEERARIENDNGATLIIVDIPIVEIDGRTSTYSTIPLGIILLHRTIITVCLKEDTFLNDFISGRVKGFVTQFKTRFVLQILYRNATRYLQYLKYIDRTSNAVEQDLHKSMRNKELIQMLKLEKSLVYFSTSLKSNEIVLEKLMKYEHIKNYDEDADLLDDVIIENKQAIEMANIYSSILSGTMDAFASVISNNLNIVMKFLTSVTIVMAIPTIVSSFFGMNVPIPLNGPVAFWEVFGIAALLCVGAFWALYRRKMF